MAKNKAFVSKHAVRLVNKLTREGMYRGDAFQYADNLFRYPERTMAQYFGRIESTIRPNAVKKLAYRVKKYNTKTKPKERKVWGKIYSKEELESAWWNKEKHVHKKGV